MSASLLGIAKSGLSHNHHPQPFSGHTAHRLARTGTNGFKRGSDGARIAFGLIDLPKLAARWP
jgi:hypothetical protein